MNEQHPYRANIPPVPDGTSRPQWSVMIPTHNCANYLRETLTSVLTQALNSEVMQIEVVDDYSTQDDPKAVVEELGQGRVSFYHQPENVGLIRNFQTCLERARGRLIHVLHGDDCVQKGFYYKMQQLFESNPEIGAGFCRHIHIDEKGHWQYISPLQQPKSGILHDWLDQIAVRQRIQTPSMVVRREVYEKLGGFDRRLHWMEDWEMWVRIAANYAVGYEVEPLALYRQHSHSNSGKKVRTGEDMQDFRRAITIIKDYLPADRADELSKKALDNYARYALDTARKFANSGDAKAALNQIREALKCHASFKVIFSSSKLSTKILSKTIKSSITKSHLSSFTRTTT